MRENKYLKVLTDCVQDEKNIREMIRAMFLVDAEIVCADDRNTDRDLIIEATDYIVEKVLNNAENRREIVRKWFGNYPNFFHISNCLKAEREAKRIDFEYTLLSKEQQMLYEDIFNIIQK